MIVAGELQGARVRTASGQSLGRLQELHVRDSEVIALTCGASALIQRFAASRRGRRIDWARVIDVRPGEVVVAD